MFPLATVAIQPINSILKLRRLARIRVREKCERYQLSAGIGETPTITENSPRHPFWKAYHIDPYTRELQPRLRSQKPTQYSKSSKGLRAGPRLDLKPDLFRRDLTDRQLNSSQLETLWFQMLGEKSCVTRWSQLPIAVKRLIFKKIGDLCPIYPKKVQGNSSQFQITTILAFFRTKITQLRPHNQIC